MLTLSLQIELNFTSFQVRRGLHRCYTRCPRPAIFGATSELHIRNVSRLRVEGTAPEHAALSNHIQVCPTLVHIRKT